MIEVTAEFLARHDRPGPRYTSYPTAVEFTDAFGPDDYEERLASAAERSADPLPLYVHLPFCKARWRLAAVFDAHTAHRTGDRPVFSKTV